MSNDDKTTIVTGDPPDDDRTRIVTRELSGELQPGDVLRDRFEVERMLGEGGMGQVFLAKDRQAEKNNPYVALKMLGNSFKEHPQAFAALRREAMQSRRLNHPNIVAVYDFDRTADHVYMVMEYLKGFDLDDLVKKRPSGSPLSEVWPLIEGCGQGLDFVHKQNIVHADFKPSNVFVTEDGGCKVLDLGIARTLDENQASAGTTRFDPDALGALTPQYASCEMFEGQTPSPLDDLYALACVVYELLTGKHPYARKTALQARSENLQPERPPGLKRRQWAALKAGLAMTRAERPASVGEFLDALNPERKRGATWPWIAVAAVALTAVGVQVFQQVSVDDEELVERIMQRYPVSLDEVVADSKASEWFQHAEVMRGLSMRAIEAGDYARASNILSNPMSSAVKNYSLVLMRSGSSEQRRLAATQVLAVMREYSLILQALEESGAEIGEQAKYACEALGLGYEPDVQSRLDALLATDEESVMDVTACRDLADSGRMSA